VYKLPKEEVVEKIALLIEMPCVKCDKKIVRKSLDLFRDNSVSFVDAHLSANVLIGRNSKLYSYDKGLRKVLGNLAVEPN